MTAFRPGRGGSGGFERRPQHATDDPPGRGLVILGYALAVAGLYAIVIGWATPLGVLIARVISAALIVSGAVLAGTIHARRGRTRTPLRTAGLIAVWAAFAGWTAYVASAPGLVR